MFEYLILGQHTQVSQMMRLRQERNVVNVAKDVAKLFNLPDSKITYVKDRAFNDQCASLSLIQLPCVRASLNFARLHHAQNVVCTQRP